MSRTHPSDQLDGYLDTPGVTGESRRERVEELVARYGPVGTELGCGHWGCVYELDAPWVLKLTFDPQEGRMWKLLAEMADADPGMMHGVARVKALMRLLPDTVVTITDPDYRTVEQRVPLHAVVREAAIPLRQRGVPSALSLKMFGDENGVGFFVKALQRYQRAAYMQVTEQFEGAWDIMGEAAQNLMTEFGEETRPLARTLRYLTNRRIALADLHAGNVGWRIHDTIEGQAAPKGLMIIDPGHSPTPPELQALIPEYRLNERPGSLRSERGR